MMLNEERTGPLFPALFSLELMVERNTGDARTVGEIRQWMKDAGFAAITTKPLREKGETYLWYFPDGTPSSKETSTSPDALPTDGWGSSAMLYAFMEGLVGVEDQLKGFEKVRLSPRWSAAGINKAQVCLSYGASNASISYDYDFKEDRILLEVKAEKADLDFHILLPKGKKARSVCLDEQDQIFSKTLIRNSHYLDFDAVCMGSLQVNITLENCSSPYAVTLAIAFWISSIDRAAIT